MSARGDYPELEHITRGLGCMVIEDAEAQCAQALVEIDRLRAESARLKAMAWTLKQLVPGHWWNSPPNQATADVLQGIKAIYDEAKP